MFGGHDKGKKKEDIRNQSYLYNGTQFMDYRFPRLTPFVDYETTRIEATLRKYFSLTKITEIFQL